MPLRVSVIGTGAMGSAVGARLVRYGADVAAWLDGRSDASVARAETSGMKRAALPDLVATDYILSIVPPVEAVAVAERLRPSLDTANPKPVWIDFNAVNPGTVARISAIVASTGTTFVGGAIIGLPALPDQPGPTFYLAGPGAAAHTALADHGLRTRLIDGPVGAAAALKMSYAGITKGLVAIASMMIVVAEREGAGAALFEELADSQAQLLARFKKTLPDMYPKAYRWVAEMREIAEFAGSRDPASEAYRAFATLYAQLSDRSPASQGRREAIDRFLAR
jgi:L-threonate 2-dehydrogenase